MLLLLLRRHLFFGSGLFLSVSSRKFVSIVRIIRSVYIFILLNASEFGSFVGFFWRLPKWLFHNDQKRTTTEEKNAEKNKLIAAKVMKYFIFPFVQLMMFTLRPNYRNGRRKKLPIAWAHRHWRCKQVSSPLSIVCGMRMKEIYNSNNSIVKCIVIAYASQ